MQEMQETYVSFSLTRQDTLTSVIIFDTILMLVMVDDKLFYPVSKYVILGSFWEGNN